MAIGVQFLQDIGKETEESGEWDGRWGERGGEDGGSCEKVTVPPGHPSRRKKIEGVS